eukprot:scaffold2299_cov131-Cylindrotheca_fusiformis.AAC.39
MDGKQGCIENCSWNLESLFPCHTRQYKTIIKGSNRADMSSNVSCFCRERLKTKNSSEKVEMVKVYVDEILGRLCCVVIRRVLAQPHVEAGSDIVQEWLLSVNVAHAKRDRPAFDMLGVSERLLGVRNASGKAIEPINQLIAPPLLRTLSFLLVKKSTTREAHRCDSVRTAAAHIKCTNETLQFLNWKGALDRSTAR